MMLLCNRRLSLSKRFLWGADLMPMSLLRATMFLAAAGAGGLSHAAIVGPYTPNINTVHLFHFDEAAGATSTANIVTGNSAIPVAVTDNTSTTAWPAETDMLGGIGYNGFGNAGALGADATQGLGYDGNGDGEYIQDSTASPTPDRINAMAALGIPTTSPAGSFTVEAMINLPTGQTIGTGNVRNIVSWDNSTSGSSSSRAVQFRLENTTGVGSVPSLSFYWFTLNRAAPDNQTLIAAPLPTSGMNAFANDTWFHVAFTHDGTTNSNQLYWTKVDPSTTTASALGASSTNVFTDVELKTSALVLGNQERNNIWNTGLRGLLDEVRISNVALGAGDFIFGSTTPPHAGDFNGDGDVDGADFFAWQTNFPTSMSATLEDGDADGDGDVDGADFVVWQTNFPFTSGSGAAPVPEPTAAILAALATFGVVAFGRWRPSFSERRDYCAD